MDVRKCNSKSNNSLSIWVNKLKKENKNKPIPELRNLILGKVMSIIMSNHPEDFDLKPSDFKVNSINIKNVFSNVKNVISKFSKYGISKFDFNNIFNMCEYILNYVVGIKSYNVNELVGLNFLNFGEIKTEDTGIKLPGTELYVDSDFVGGRKFRIDRLVKSFNETVQLIDSNTGILTDMELPFDGILLISEPSKKLNLDEVVYTLVPEDKINEFIDGNIVNVIVNPSKFGGVWELAKVTLR